MTAILHCLVHCVPVQRYFLRDAGHHYASCKVYRKKVVRPTKAAQEPVCLACEMDRLFLRYMGSALGLDVLSAIDSMTAPHSNDAETNAPSRPEISSFQGEPLLTADMLTAAWQCMNHLAGYEQRDAHEFLHGFLDTLGKHMKLYRIRMAKAVNTARPANVYLSGDGPVQYGTCDTVVHRDICVVIANKFFGFILSRRSQEHFRRYTSISVGML
jgi:Ubiquitin carboxyl-terminal hydrolase